MKGIITVNVGYCEKCHPYAQIWHHQKHRRQSLHTYLHVHILNQPVACNNFIFSRYKIIFGGCYIFYCIQIFRLKQSGFFFSSLSDFFFLITWRKQRHTCYIALCGENWRHEYNNEQVKELKERQNKKRPRKKLFYHTIL